jgi:hypothetical protein
LEKLSIFTQGKFFLYAEENVQTSFLDY